ncbi:MAG: hypothetical protein A2Z34_00255 [Planctomycetes bacterium RBG_16_59_8]|nr:MAG: hypothetical protein A2Z34_00255 [Planctomycetes bacterium RBG_16_59_8]
MSVKPLLILFGLASLSAAGNGDEEPRRVYEKSCRSVAGIRAIAPLGERSGSGIVITPDGYLLTSSAIVPNGSREIRVWLPGARRVEAVVAGMSKRGDLTILKIDPARNSLTPMEFGEGKPRIGDSAYTIGNAFFSIINDDQPSFSAGIVSGIYNLPEERGGSSYTGQVVETSAAVNPGMEGGALLDGGGKLVGVLTPNYSIQRWLGAAIPLDVVRGDIERCIAAHRSAGANNGHEAERPASRGFIGIEVAERDGRLVVASVRKESPAWKRGIREGDVILAVTEKPVATGEEFRERFAALAEGDTVWLTVDVGGEGAVEKIKIILAAPPDGGTGEERE